MELQGYFEGVDPFVDIFFEGCVEPTKVLVDTGFTGELMLPEDALTHLNLVEVGEDIYTTASGDEINTTIYIGSIGWFGRTKRATDNGDPADPSDDSIVAMQYDSLNRLIDPTIPPAERPETPPEGY